jgi:hypothetical protein
MYIKHPIYFGIIGSLFAMLNACGDGTQHAQTSTSKEIHASATQYQKPGTAGIDIRYTVPKHVAIGESTDIDLEFTPQRQYPSGSRLTVEIKGDKEGLSVIGQDVYTFSLDDDAPFIVSANTLREPGPKPYLRAIATVEHEGQSAKRHFVIVVGEQALAAKKPELSANGEPIHTLSVKETILPAP